MLISREALGSIFALAISAMTVLGSATCVQAENLRVGEPLPRMRLLKAGSHRYVRYIVNGENRIAHDIWDRSVTFEERNGHRLIHITQRWDEVSPALGKPSLIEQDSWFDSKDFRPLSQVRRVTVEGRRKVTGYRFTNTKAVGMTDLAENDDPNYSALYGEEPYNFQYDMEMFQVLPLREGYEVSIPFFDVGIDKKADRYTFKVAASDQIPGWDGRPVDCWVLTADYNTGKVQSRWWIDKASQIVIREEAPRDDGSLLIKVLLPPEAAKAALANPL